MPPTALTADTPYNPWEVQKFYEVPTIANPASPTRSEMNAGTDLSPEVTEWSGFGQTGSTTDSQALVGPALKLPGPPTLDDSSITARRSKTGTDIRDVLPYGYEGFIISLPDGDVAARSMDVFKVQVNGNPNSTSITDAATKTINFAVIGAWFDVTIPALT